MTWLLCDYGMVLSVDQSDEDRRLMAAQAGVSVDRLMEGYWRHRDGYDHGRLSAGDFWSAVAGRELGDQELDRLVALDVASWSHPNRATLEVVGAAARAGLRLGVLSNAPHEVADAIEEGLADDFEVGLFSARLGLLKPDVAIYRAALQEMGDPDPGDVWFFDDRQVNVDGALAAGLRAERFYSPEQMRAALGL